MTRTFTNYSKILTTLLIGVVCCWNVAYAQVSTFPATENFDAEGLCENTAFAPADNGDCPLAGAWSQDDTDDWDFSVEADATGSSGTGPSVDHTQGDGVNGKYLFTETSGAGSNSTFILNGDATGYDVSALSCPFIEVWYHALGGDVGLVEVHLEASDDGGTTYASIASVVGPASEDAWKLLQGNLSAYSGGTVHLQVRVLTGAGFASDIGIDDVNIFDNSAAATNIALSGLSTSAGCDASDSETLTVFVTNGGCTDIAAGEVEATIEVDGGGEITEALPAIGPGETVEYTFTATFDFATPGDYIVDASVDFTATSGLTDADPADNSIVGATLTITEFFGSIDGDSPDYAESFEAGPGGWSVVDVGTNPSTMVLGAPGTAPLDGTQAWFHDTTLANNAGEPYNANELVFFQTGCFDLSCMATATFSIDINYDTEAAWDGATIGFNTDGGTTFNILGIDDGLDTGTSDGTGVNWYNDTDIDGISNEIDGWSGNSGGWVTATHDISSLAGFSNVRFAVIFGSDGSGQPGTGVAFDNVQVTAATTDAACLGCVDAGACNFDADATYDDASCEYLTCAGCTDAGACNFDSDATIDDSSCDFSCLGCMDAAACNFDADATIDDGSCNLGFCGDGVCDLDCGEDTDGCADCVGIVPGCIDVGACNYNPDATVDDGSCDFDSCGGCMDVTACNFDALATIDDGSCIFGTCGNGICEPVCGETVSNCNDCAIRLGCTDSGAHNYSPRATDPDPDNPCETCTDGIMNGDEVAIDCGGALCGPCDMGCMDVDAHNYDAIAVVDDGSCETCADGIMNGDETGVDCGGSNPNCGICGDLCINALDIACGDAVTGDTNNNTGDDLPANCGGVSSPDAGVWYTFTGTGESVKLSTDNPGGDYDTNLQIFSGDCGALNCVGGDEDGSDENFVDYSSEFTFASTAGTSYYIYVSGWNGSQGAYELSMDCFFPLNIAVDAVSPVPASGIGTASVGVTVTGGNTDCGPLTYAWTGPNVPDLSTITLLDSIPYTASTEDISDITMVGDYILIATDCLGNQASDTVRVDPQTRGRRRKAAEIVTSQFQAAPNPFANATMISFEVNTEEEVSLDVFDIRGAKVATLFDGTTEAGQSYQVEFGEAMPSGTYIAKLTTSNGQIQHIKLFLTK